MQEATEDLHNETLAKGMMIVAEDMILTRGTETTDPVMTEDMIKVMTMAEDMDMTMKTERVITIEI